jgi:hypothetical protein
MNKAIAFQARGLFELDILFEIDAQVFQFSVFVGGIVG